MSAYPVNGLEDPDMSDETRAELARMKREQIEAIDARVACNTAEIGAIREAQAGIRATADATLDAVNGLVGERKTEREADLKYREKREANDAAFMRAKLAAAQAEAEAEAEGAKAKSATVAWLRETFDAKTIAVLLAIAAAAFGLQPSTALTVPAEPTTIEATE